MTIEEFIAYIAPVIADDSNKRNVLPSPRIAQAILESGHGTSELALKARNLFGLKDNNQWGGKIYNKITGEYYDGNYTEVSANFQCYDTWEESVYWQGWYLQNRKYSPTSTTLVYGALQGVRDYKTFCHLLKTCGYATGPQYAEHLIDIIEKYDLTKYDTMDVTMQAPDYGVPIGKLALTVGHSRLKSGNYTSANGIPFGGVLEYEYNKELAPLIKKWVEKANWVCDVIICPEKEFSSSRQEKPYKINIVNNKNAKYDLVCELHLNASANHSGTGCEVLYISDAGKKYAMAVSERLSKLIEKHGSGISHRDNLYMLTKTTPVSIMIESFFCDNPSDCKAMLNKDAVAKAIAEGIVGRDISESSAPIVTEQPKPVDKNPGNGSSPNIKYWVQCGAFGIKANATKQVSALKRVGVDSFVKELNGLHVVQAGAFSTKEAANTQLDRIRSKGFQAILRTTGE